MKIKIFNHSMSFIGGEFEMSTEGHKSVQKCCFLFSCFDLIEVSQLCFEIVWCINNPLIYGNVYMLFYDTNKQAHAYIHIMIYVFI